MQVNRREAIGAFAGSAAYHLLAGHAAKAQEYEPKALAAYNLPDSVGSIDIGRIVNILSSARLEHSQETLKAVADFWQYMHQISYGTTLQSRRHKNFGVAAPIELQFVEDPNDASNPTDIALMTQKSEKIVIRHAAMSDTNLFLMLLHRNLDVMANGPGKVRSYARLHQDFAHASSMHHELLWTPGTECPLYYLMKFYLGSHGPGKDGATVFKLDQIGLAYMYFLSRFPDIDSLSFDGDRTTVKDATLDSAAMSAEKQGIALDEKMMKEAGLGLEKGGFGFMRDVAETFVRRTTRYVVSNNPMMPDEKKKLAESLAQDAAKQWLAQSNHAD